MNNKIMIVWGSIIALICSLLIILGNVGTDYELYKYEKRIKYAAREYFSDNVYDTQVFIDDLIDNNYLRSNDLINKYCISEVKKNKRFYFVNTYQIIKECE